MSMYLKDQLQGFVPDELAGEIIKDVARGSSVIRLSRAVEMKTPEKKVPVMTSGAGAYWVGEGERIQTSASTWIFPKLTAKKLAVIVPVTKEKLNDATIDVFGEMRESIAEAFYTAIDKACLFKQNSPFESSVFGPNTNSIAFSGALDLDASDVMAQVEEAGYDVDGFVAEIGVKNRLRKLRDNNGAALYVDGTNQREFYSQPIEFVRNNAWDKEKALLIAGEWKYSLFGMLQGIEYEILKEATLQGTLDADGKPLSLAEQDMVAIKATMRVAYLNVKDDAFAALVPSDASSNVLRELKVTTAAGIAAVGDTVVTVAEAAAEGNKFVYKAGKSYAAVPAYDAELTGWTDLPADGTINVAEGKEKLTVAEVTAGNKARARGVAAIERKAE